MFSFQIGLGKVIKGFVCVYKFVCVRVNECDSHVYSLRVFVCVCVCVYVCVCMCVCVCVRVRVCRWDEGVLTMQLGEEAKLVCTSDYAYGHLSLSLTLSLSLSLTYDYTQSHTHTYMYAHTHTYTHT